MLDSRIIAVLDDPDAERRKKAVRALAKSADREAIPYLDEVANFDDDAVVRDMAEKAIRYIDKLNPGPVDDDDPFSDNPFADIGITPTQQRRTRRSTEYDGATSQALDGGAIFNRGAVRSHGNAVQRLGKRNTITPIETYTLIVAMMAGLVMAVSFLLLPWYDMGDLRNLFGFAPGIAFEATGFDVFTSKLEGDFHMNLGWNNNSSLFESLYFLTGLVLLAPVVQIALGTTILITKKPQDSWFWIQMFVLAILCLVAFAWTYFDLLPLDTRLDFFIPSPENFLGTGFWVCLASTLVFFCAAAIGQFYLQEETD